MQNGILGGVAQRIRREISESYHKTLFSRLVPQAREAYATHMPILMGLAGIVRPKRVLELGSGMCSTPQFVNKETFPTIEFLHSLEDDAAWADKVQQAIGADNPRCMLERVPSVPGWADKAELNSYDLIFVDDSTTIVGRTSTLRAVIAKASPNAVVVVHDFEIRSYQRVVPADVTQLVVPAFKPMTGIITRKRALLPQLKQLRKAVNNNRHLSPSDLGGWTKIFGDTM